MTSRRSARARELEEAVLELCERAPEDQTPGDKQRLYGLVGQFLLTGPNAHWWCTYPTLMTYMVRLLELYPEPVSVRVFYKSTARQLGLCRKCVDAYHASLPTVRAELEFEFTESSVRAFFQKISQLDADRIREVFTVKTSPGLTMTTASRDGSDQVRAIETALYEVLRQRRLWSDFRIIRVISKWITSNPAQSKDSIDTSPLRHCPGVYQWLVSPDSGIRAWATSLVAHFGHIDMSTDVSNGEPERAVDGVLDEWMYILENNSFNVSLLSLDLPATEELPLFLDTSTCVKTPTNQTLWAALDTVMQRMNEDSLESMLESYDNLPDLVFNYLNDADPSATNPQVTFVIGKCYGSLMKCLGHRYWNHTVHTPKVVLDMILQHCCVPSWRVFVTKQLLELLPPLLHSMRPPSITVNESNKGNVEAYFAARERVLLLLIDPSRRPAHFKEQVVNIAAGRAVSTIICDCYEPRLAALTSKPTGTGDTNVQPRDDGALPEQSLVDYSVAESAFWWPCGPKFASLEKFWMNYLFELLVNPQNVASLVDHVAVTYSTVLSKHLSLARDNIYSVLIDLTLPPAVPVPSVPIVTQLLEKVCAWKTIATIPIPVHGALFESIGGAAELLNAIGMANQDGAADQAKQVLRGLQATMVKYESVVGAYLERIGDEVLVKGLSNPLHFPVVAQHVTLCLLSPTKSVDHIIKRLLGNATASKTAPDRVASPLESMLVAVHRNTEAYLRGMFNILQTLRVVDFALTVTIPTMKKTIFTWSKVFDMLGGDVRKVMSSQLGFGNNGDSTTSSTTSAGNAPTGRAISLQRLPILLGDLIVQLLSQIYGLEHSSDRNATANLDEAFLTQCLDFGISFWAFCSTDAAALSAPTSEPTSTMASVASSSSKRFSGIILPLIQCMEHAGAAEKRRAVELLMLVLEGFLRGGVRIDDTLLRRLEVLQNSTSVASIKSKRSTDFGRVVRKLKQVTVVSRFFQPRSTKQPKHQISTQSKHPLPIQSRLNNTSSSSSSSRFVDLTKDDDLLSAQNRPMSARAAAREQARLASERSAASTIFETGAPKHAHSFYTEDDMVGGSASRKSGSSDTAKKNRTTARGTFSISQVVKDMPLSHLTGRADADSRSHGGTSGHSRGQEKEIDSDDDDDDDDDDESATHLTALFHKIKSTQKPIPSCSLMPFYRHLLQVCMPTLLTRDFDDDRNSGNRELIAPALTFNKNSEYVNAFLPLLLEECHNEVQEGLQRCYYSAGGGRGSSDSHLMRYESEKPREGMRCISLSVVEAAEASTNKTKNARFGRREKLFRNADVVLLRAIANDGGNSGGNGRRRRRGGGGQANEFLGVILISETERDKRRQSGGGGNVKQQNGKDSKNNSNGNDEELVKVLFLNDGELESVTGDIPTFQMEALAAGAISDSEWRVTTLGNLVTAAREYVALRSVDMFPAHLRSTILTPNEFKSTQTELLTMTTVLDELRMLKSHDSDKKIARLLKKLGMMDVTLTDLRSTSIGKAVNKLRKHEDNTIKKAATQLKDKWTALMDARDALDAPPRYVPNDLWSAVKTQYNQSQLQSVHSVLNNYRTGLSLLQGPPGTGKTKTIMGLLSCFLAMNVPASAVALRPSASRVHEEMRNESATASIPAPSAKMPSTGSFANFEKARDMAVTQSGGSSGGQRSKPVLAPGFSLAGVATSSKILHRSEADAWSGAKPRTMQSLKSVSSVRSRLEQKLTSNSKMSSSTAARSNPSGSALVRRTMLAPSVVSAAARRTCHVLLCAPSNGAVDELVLRIVTDGLMDNTGKSVSVRAPSVHNQAHLSDSSGGQQRRSIVRLGYPGEDAPESVRAVCLPHIIKQELEIHPKTIELRQLQDRQQTLRNSIREFHNNKNTEAAADTTDATDTTETGEQGEKSKRRGGNSRKALVKMHSELTECSGRVRRLRDEASKLYTKLTAAILCRASIIACTLSKAGSGPLASLPRGFDALIIDEAAQAVELSTLVPIRERVARVVLVGDPKQLPATVKSVAAAAARYDRSLFERVAESGVAPSMLRVQYRMHPFLREFPSKRFYGGMLTDGPSVMERVQKVCGDVYKHTLFQPFMLYDLVDTREDESSGSKYNQAEAAFCIELCAALFTMCPSLLSKKWSVGFVSPYKEQVHVLRQHVSRSSIPSSLSIEVNTVDGFQGREKDVIIFSCVRASERGGIGFLKDIRRLNVAITRARFCLFVVGNVRTLRRDETWRALVDSAQERRLVIKATTSGNNSSGGKNRLPAMSASSSSVAASGFARVIEEIKQDDQGLKTHFEQMHDKITKKWQASTASGGTATNTITTTEKKKEAGRDGNSRDVVMDDGGDIPQGLSVISEAHVCADDGHRHRDANDRGDRDIANKRRRVEVSDTKVGRSEDSSHASRDTSRERSAQTSSTSTSSSLSSKDLKRPASNDTSRGRDASTHARSKTARTSEKDSHGDSRRSSSSRDERQSSRSGNAALDHRTPRYQVDQRSAAAKEHRQRVSSSAHDRDEHQPRLVRSTSTTSNVSSNSDRGSESSSQHTSRPLTTVPSQPNTRSDASILERRKHEDRQARLRAIRDGRTLPGRPASSLMSHGGRVVQLARSSATTGGADSRRAIRSGASSGGLLSSILGASSKLSDATSRVHDKASGHRGQVE